MNGRDILISFAVLMIIIIIMGTSFVDRGSNIANAVDDKYPLKSTDGSIRVYNSNEDVNNTVNSIDSIKRPYDQKVDAKGKAILLYDEAVIVIEDKEGNTEIELIKDHQRAYNRHRNTMIIFWGSNLYSKGRIRTPRSLRNGSIGSSPSRGGGFGFGK